MTVEELISLNACIGDLVVEVRENGHSLVWIYRYGVKAGDVKPNHFGGDRAEIRQKMTFSPKPINSMDKGKDYYEILVNQIPENVRNLEVYSFDSRRAYRPARNMHSLEEIHITALPSAQLTIGNFMREVTE